MKKIVAGGFLSIIGCLLVLPILLGAVLNPTTSWFTPPGRLITTISESGMLLFFMVAIILLILGIVLIIRGAFKRDNQ